MKMKIENRIDQTVTIADDDYHPLDKTDIPLALLEDLAQENYVWAIDLLKPGEPEDEGWYFYNTKPFDKHPNLVELTAALRTIANKHGIDLY